MAAPCHLIIFGGGGAGNYFLYFLFQLCNTDKGFKRKLKCLPIILREKKIISKDYFNKGMVHLSSCRKTFVFFMVTQSRFDLHFCLGDNTRQQII